MKLISIKRDSLTKIEDWFERISMTRVLIILAYFLSILSTIYSYSRDIILSYGDSESHINIAKRVVDSLTPGMAQLGGVWLPLPHLLMVPLVKIDFLWRSGLAGSIVSGALFVIGAVFIYKLTYLLTNHKLASFISFLIYVLNPNILYLQSTPLTELPLITFIILSGYYFVSFLKKENITALMLAALFGFCATLSRYDGWFLVLTEAGILGLKYIFQKASWRKMEGYILLFATPAFLGILMWFAWDWLILGDPLYFTSSPYSAKSQQQNWSARGQLPASHNLPLSFVYYFADSMSNVGVIIFALFILGMVVFINSNYKRFIALTVLLLMSPFIFNIITLYMGQSVIFIPHITPVGFDWRLFNARYGSLMVPTAAFFVGYLFYKLRTPGRLVILFLMILQLGLYGIGYSQVISFQDGQMGLSSAKRPDAERWLKQNYDGGLVLIDDFSRATSVVRSGIPMQNIIYIGNKPYWEESLKEPEKHARWIIAQKDDAIWKGIIDQPELSARLYGHFNKAYTSPDILIFKKY